MTIGRLLTNVFGGSTSMFGPRGPASLLQGATTLVAVLFMGTSITLAAYSNPKTIADSQFFDAAQHGQLEAGKLERLVP